MSFKSIYQKPHEHKLLASEVRASSPGVQGPFPPHAPRPVPRPSSAPTLALGSAKEAHTHSSTSLHLLTVNRWARSLRLWT